MTRVHRCVLCAGFLLVGLAAQAGLEHLNQTERPPLRRPLAEIPMELGDWVGRDEPVAADIVERAQTTEYLNRVYESRKQPGLRAHALDQLLREGDQPAAHAGDLPAVGGLDQDRIADQVLEIAAPDGKAVRITRLGYGRGELVEHVGFWYYIFGEGKLENFVRQLPITSRSSHGRTTRGSSMTVEIFCPGDHDPDGEALGDFARALLASLEPILPVDRAEYHVP